MKRNVSVVRFKFCYNIFISGKIIKEIPVSVVRGTHCVCVCVCVCVYVYIYICAYVCKILWFTSSYFSGSKYVFNILLCKSASCADVFRDFRKLQKCSLANYNTFRED